MVGVPRIVVVLLLCLASIGGISAAAIQEGDGSMSIVSQEETAEYLAPAADRIDRHSQRTASIDVAGAVDGKVGGVRSTYSRVNLERTYREAETTDERRAVVRNGSQRLGETVQGIERQQRLAIERYSNGQISEPVLFRTLTTVDRKARASGATVDWLATKADNLGLHDTETRLSFQRSRLRMLQGPVRASIYQGISGEETPRVHVDVSGGGIVLATVKASNGDDRYLREAYDPSARTDEFDDGTDLGLSAAEERLRELYPWVTNNSTPTAAPIGPDYARLWRFTYSHSHGTLETYLDAGTNQIVLERQYLDPDSVPTTTTEIVDGDLGMTLNRTHAGGPLGVSVYHVSTGDPVDATVTIDGDSVGRTGGDRLWTVTPRGNATINATYQGEAVSYRTTFE